MRADAAQCRVLRKHALLDSFIGNYSHDQLYEPLFGSEGGVCSLLHGCELPAVLLQRPPTDTLGLLVESPWGPRYERDD